MSPDAAQKLVPPYAFSDGVRVYTETNDDRGGTFASWQQQLDALKEIAKLQEMGAITTEEATSRAAAVISGKSITDHDD